MSMLLRRKIISDDTLDLLYLIYFVNRKPFTVKEKG